MRGPAIERCRAYAIHVFTASGAALGLLALFFAAKDQWAPMFVCLGVALLVDGLDGPIAREFNVAQVVPRYSGETLDLVVDFTTYVFVPAYALSSSGQLPQVISLLCGIVIVVTGALYFADREMKAAGNYFKGFPAVWNVIAFYIFLLDPPAWIAALIVLVFAGLTFAPVPFVHPLRVRERRSVNIALAVLWGVLALIAVATSMAPGIIVTTGLCLIAIYFLASSAMRQEA